MYSKTNQILGVFLVRQYNLAPLLGQFGKEPDSAPFDYHRQSTLVGKMKSFGVDAEWIPGEERVIDCTTHGLLWNEKQAGERPRRGRARRSRADGTISGPAAGHRD